MFPDPPTAKAEYGHVRFMIVMIMIAVTLWTGIFSVLAPIFT